MAVSRHADTPGSTQISHNRSTTPYTTPVDVNGATRWLRLARVAAGWSGPGTRRAHVATARKVEWRPSDVDSWLRESRVGPFTVKATEAAKIPEMQPRGSPRRIGRGTFGRWRITRPFIALTYIDLIDIRI